MLPVIYHMADIHISNNTARYDEYNKVFESVYKKLELDKREKIIVICGDLYDNKTVINTTTLKFVSIFISKLIKYGDLILINGNHDVSMQNETIESTIESMLTLSSEMNLKGIDKIHFLNENKIYNIKGINFGLTTMFTNEITKINNKKDNEIYIGLYHGKVIGSKTDIGFKATKNNSNYNINDFREYDLVLLGDIHKHQYLNKTIAYSSSLVQKDYGETIRNHGLIIWDPNDLTSEFIEIHNDWCMLKCKFENNILEFEENVNLNDYKNIRAKIEYKSKDIKKIGLLEKRLRKMYNFKEINMYQEIESIEEKTDYSNTKIDDNINNILDKYINKTTHDNTIKDQMKSQVFKMISTNKLDKEQKIRKIDLKYLVFGNLFCYGNENKINFQNLNKINGIVAENGFGKSSIIDVILYTIYQKCGRASGTKVLNKFKKNSYSILVLDINEETYIIFRKIVPDTQKTFRDDLTFLKLKDNFKIDYEKINLLNIEYLILEEKNRLTPKTEEHKKIIQKIIFMNSVKKIDTNQLIVEYLGSYDELTDNNILLQNGNNFLNKTDKDKKDIMYKIFGITNIDKLYTLIRNKYNNIKTEITKKVEEMLKKFPKTENMKLEIYNLQDDCVMINEQLELLREEINNEEYNFNKLNEITYNQTNYNDIIDELKKYENNYIKNDKIINKLKENFNIKKNSEIEDILNKINNIKNNLKVLQKEISLLESKKNKINHIKNISETEKQFNINNKLIEKNKIKIDLLNENIIDNTNLIDEIKKAKKIVTEYNLSKKLFDELNEENKYLLQHKFNDSCIQCINNKKIHKKINYKEKIDKLNNFIEENNNIEEELQDLENILSNKNKIKELSDEINSTEEQNKNIIELLKINKQNLENEELNNKINIEINKLKIEHEEINYEYDECLKNYNILKDYINEQNKLEYKIENYRKIELNWRKNEENILIIKDIILNREYNKKKKIILENKEKELTKKLIISERELEEKCIYEDNILNMKLELIEIHRLESLFSSDNLIENLLSQIIKNLEGIINNVLKDLTDFRLKFNISSTGISIFKELDDEYIDANNLSGYEMFCANMALRIAFTKLNKFVRNNFLIIDEGFNSCSSTNIHKISSLFDNIKNYFKWCIAVSHIDIIKSHFDFTHHIRKNGKDSVINI